MRLTGKTAIITGAGRGIGRAIAETFAREGCRVLVTDIDGDNAAAVAQSIQANGGQAESRVLDVSSRPDVAALVKEAAESFGKLDIMVNNAGVSAGPWTQTLSVNLMGVAFGTRYAARAMAASGGGSIINTASTAGLVAIGAPPDTGTDAYVASKHAVVGLTKEFALAFGADGVRVNCVCPGATETEMTRGLLSIEANRRKLVEATPLRRTATPQEIANVFLFLASDESSFITGAAIVVDGGLTAVAGGGGLVAVEHPLTSGMRSTPTGA